MDSASEAGSDIVNNIGEAIDEVSTIATTAGKNLSKVSIKSAHATATAYQEATDASVLDNIELIEELKKDGGLKSSTVPTLDGSSPLTPPRADK